MKATMALCEGKIKLSDLARNWAVSWAGNFIGSLAVLAVVLATGLLPAGSAAPIKVALAKTSLSFGEVGGVDGRGLSRHYHDVSLGPQALFLDKRTPTYAGDAVHVELATCNLGVYKEPAWLCLAVSSVEGLHPSRSGAATTLCLCLLAKWLGRRVMFWPWPRPASALARWVGVGCEEEGRGVGVHREPAWLFANQPIGCLVS